MPTNSSGAGYLDKKIPGRQIQDIKKDPLGTMRLVVPHQPLPVYIDVQGKERE
ncbi:uncharacterized protein BDW70DRAFT_145419 [Aspergillus foveolatus]|uniref:uncharacterized protein n=1 Tax=Aspergillus foveolatus TaxID=210207 RepID=UPI003CCE1B12